MSAKTLMAILLPLIWLCSAVANATVQLEPYKLSAGLFEGIGADFAEVKLLEINQQAPHRFVTTLSGDGFKNAKIYFFDDTDIRCDNVTCSIITQLTDQSSEQVRLILSPYLDDGLTVMEIHSGTTGEIYLTEGYRLTHTKGPSMVKRFLDANLQQLRQLKPVNDDEITGFWLGILTRAGKRELIKLYLDKKSGSVFTHYFSGMTVNNEIAFNNSQIQRQGLHYLISLDTPIAAVKLMLPAVTNGQNMVEGYYYTELSEQVVQTGSLTLYRLGR